MPRKTSFKKSKDKKLKLIKVVKSPKKEKKYRAVFSREGRIKNVDFGSFGMSDYTIHKDSKRKTRYENRHKKRENWNDPTTAGALSKWILWNKPSFKSSLADYKKRFKL